MPKDYVRSSRHTRADSYQGGGWRWILAGVLIALFAAGILYLKQQSDKLAAEGDDTSGGSFIQRTLKKQEQPQAPAPNQLNTNSAKPKSTTPTTSSTPQPKFDFYTMLPKEQLAGETKTIASPPPPAPKPKTVTANAEQPAIQTAPVQPSITTSSPTTTTAKQPTQQSHSASPSTSAIPDLTAIEEQKLDSAKPISKNKSTDQTLKKPTAYLIQLGLFKNYSDADQLKAQLVLAGYEVQIKNVKRNNIGFYQVWMGPYSSLDEAKKQQRVLQQNQIKSKISKD